MLRTVAPFEMGYSTHRHLNLVQRGGESGEDTISLRERSSRSHINPLNSGRTSARISDGLLPNDAKTEDAWLELTDEVWRRVNPEIRHKGVGGCPVDTTMTKDRLYES